MTLGSEPSLIPFLGMDLEDDLRAFAVSITPSCQLDILNKDCALQFDHCTLWMR